MDEKQASMMHVMKETMTEFMMNDDPPKSNDAEGSAAVRGSPRGTEPTAARGAYVAAAAAAAGGRARGDTTPARETTLRQDASRNFGVTGCGGAVVPV